MAGFQDLITQIKSLRQQRRDSEDNYYNSLLNVKAATVQLNKIAQGVRLKAVVDVAQVNIIKGQISDVDAQIKSVSASIAELTAVEDNLSSVRKQIDGLSKNIASVQTPPPAVTGTHIDVTPNKIVTPVVSPETIHPAPTPRATPRPATQGITPPHVTPAPAPQPMVLKSSVSVSVSAASDAVIKQAHLDLLNKQLLAAQNNEKQLVTQVQASQTIKADFVKKQIDLSTQKASLEKQLFVLHTPVEPDNQAVSQKIATETAKKNLALQTINSHDASLSQLLNQLYVDPHPKSVLTNLDDHIPFLLLPVRMETKFMVESGKNELWVRIYPDEIAIHTHEAVLTNDEAAAGKLYWTELLVARQLNKEADSRKKNAWSYVKGLFGPQRAAWVIKQMKPADWATLTTPKPIGLIQTLLATDPNFLNNLSATAASDVQSQLKKIVANNDGDELMDLADEQKWTGNINDMLEGMIKGFPEQPAVKTDAWSRAARSYVMPDKFVLILDNGTISLPSAPNPREVIGKQIPDLLYLTPEPMDQQAFPMLDGLQTISGNCAWTTDFTLAQNNGLGFIVPISDAEALSGFKRIFALGLYLSADKEGSANMIEELINNHHCSPKDFSLVPIGTQAHGGDKNSSTQDDDTWFLTEFDTPLFQPSDNTDGKRLCDALGISYAALQNVRFSDNDDFMQARAMNTALYPTSLGFYIQTLLNPIFGPVTQQLVRNFFTNYVTARGPLASIRVGNQPYGILPTSDFSKWDYTLPVMTGPLPTDNLPSFLKRLSGFLTFLRNNVWAPLADTLPRIRKGDANPDATLMDIIGLQPSTVEFYQRVGYSLDLLLNQDALQFQKKYDFDINQLKTSGSTLLNFLGNNGWKTVFGGTQDLPQLLQIYYQHFSTPLDGSNLISTDLLSETNTLNPNYINLLANADLNILQTQNFGAGVDTPTSLLYMMLRSALLLNLYEGSYNWLKNNSISFEIAEPFKAQTIIGVRATGNFTKSDVISVTVGKVQPLSLDKNLSIGDLLLRDPQNQPESTYLAEMKQALNLLAGKPTSSLERSFTEHLDLCSYRLDAWETGLFAMRLEELRGNSPGGGIFLGAYGWVEDLVPTAKTKVPPQSVPAKLMPNNQTVFEDIDNGGFVHAPSLNHAAAAAVLRSGYMSHATQANPDIYAVNLSSKRLRNALFLIDGMRNGQGLEVLLGYQFERGLHDRSSANPALSLNQFIYYYRSLFPVSYQQIPNEGSPEQESISPDNVVNGAALASATLAGNNLSMQLTQNLNDDQRAAILAEQDNLRDSIDAIQDLLLAENAFQLVKGNISRVAALSISQKEANIPPEPEVITTPRSSQLTFTNRVTLHFDVPFLTDADINPWKPVPMSVRAIAEPGLNKWLGGQLGDPEKIVCNVCVMPASGNDAPPTPDPVLKLSELMVQPIDLLYMVSDQMDSQGVSELEARIAFQYRKKFSLNNNAVVSISFNPPNQALTIANILPLVKTLKKIMSGAKPLNAMDFTPSSVAFPPLDSNNPELFDVAELENRISQLQKGLQDLSNYLNGVMQMDGLGVPTVSFTIQNTNGSVVTEDTSVAVTLAKAFQTLNENNIAFTNNRITSVSISNNDILTLIEILERISMYGVPDAVPKLPYAAIDDPAVPVNPDKLAILEQARVVNSRLNDASTSATGGILTRVKSMLGAMPAGSIAKIVSQYCEIAKTLLGKSFNILPRFSYNNASDISQSDSARNQLFSSYIGKNPGITVADVVNDWIQGASYVRPNLHKWETVRTLCLALGGLSVDMLAVQLPLRTNDSWLAVELPAADPQRVDQQFHVIGDTLSIVAHGSLAFTGAKQTGILIDNWTEEIPTGDEITGIAFNYNRPNNYAPQALLLAISPKITGSWQWDSLVGTLNNTLDRAKSRTADQDKLESSTAGGSTAFWDLLAPALVSEFSTTDANISLDLAKNLNLAKIAEFYKTTNK